MQCGDDVFSSDPRSAISLFPSNKEERDVVAWVVGSTEIQLLN
jgi:hypothetical protein